MEISVEQALLESPIIGFAHHRIILDGAGKPVDYEFLAVNATFERLTGLPREKILHRTLREALPDIITDEFDWIAFYGAVALGGGEKSFEQQSQYLNRWYRVHAYSPEPLCFSTVFLDITDSKAAEERLQQKTDLLLHEQERLRGIIEGTNIGTWEWDILTGKTVFNERWAEIIGYSLAEITPTTIETWGSFCHPDDLKKSEELLQRHFDGLDEYYQLEARMRHRDGRWVWVLDRGRVISRTPEGRPQVMMGTHQDITRQKEAEAELKAREENFRTLFETMPDMIVVSTPAGRVLYANQRMRTTLGYSLEELEKIGVLGVHPAEKQEEARTIFAAMLQGERDYCPLPLQAKDGRLIPVETRVSLGRWFQEDCIFGVIKDLSQEQAALQKFDKIFEANPAAMALSQLPERRFVDVNQAFLLATGYSRSEVIGKGSAELGLFVDPKDICKTGELLQRDGCIRNLEIKIQRKDGTRLDGLFSGELLNIQGVDYVLTLMYDISEAKATQRLVEETSLRLQLATQAGRVGVWDYDVINDRLEWDDQMYGLYGIKPEGFTNVYQSWRAGLHPEDLTREEQEIQLALRGEKDFDTEFRVVWPDGSIRHIRAMAMVLRDEAGSPVRMIGTNWDITEQKQAEAQLTEMSFLQGFLIEIATVFIDIPQVAAHNTIDYALGELGRFIGADRAYIFEYDWQSRVAQNTFEWCAEGIPPQIDNLQAVPLEVIPAWVQTHQRGQVMLVEDVSALAPQDPLREVLEPQEVKSLIALPMMSDGDCLGFVGFDSVKERRTYSDDAQKLLFVFALMLVNLNKRNRTQEELTAALQAAQAATIAKGQFLANMSHEIRTPLNGVVGFLDLLGLSQLSQEQAEHVRDAKVSAELLLSLINDILDFSKIEAGKLALEQVAFNLRRAVDDAVALLSTKAAAKGLSLYGIIGPGVPEVVKGDPSRLKQILGNLLSNAVKFTAAGEVVVRVDCPNPAAEGETAWVLITVRDTGIGLDAATQAGLFAPFTQADASTTRKYGGTGLGLAISKQLVTMMGGQVKVSSQLGEGAEFIVSLPMTVVKAAYELSPELQGLAGIPVLLVSNDAVNRRIIRGYLQEAGVPVSEAGDGGSCIAEIVTRAGSERAFRAALIDSQLPGMNGYELASALSHIPAAMDIKMILLTRPHQRNGDTEADSVTFAANLTKPIRRDDLLNCLAGVLDLVDAGKSLAETAVPADGKEAAKVAGKRILLAEDNEINAKIVVKLLANKGLSCDVAFDGEEAFRAATEQNYDLILMDCQMPVLDGYGSTDKIRQWEGDARHTPIIALTANAMEGDREKCLACGMDGYLSKPLQPQALYAVIATHTAAPAGPPIAGELAGDELRPKGILAQHQAEFRAALGLAKDETEEIFSEFAGYLTDILQKIEAAVTDKDIASLAAHAHRLKGSAGTLRLVEISDPAAELEKVTMSWQQKVEQGEGASQIDWAAVQKLQTALKQGASSFLQALAD